MSCKYTLENAYGLRLKTSLQWISFVKAANVREIYGAYAICDWG